MSDRPIYFRQINHLEVVVRTRKGSTDGHDLAIRFAKRPRGAKPSSTFEKSDLTTLLLLIQDVQHMFSPLLKTPEGDDFDDLCL